MLIFYCGICQQSARCILCPEIFITGCPTLRPSGQRGIWQYLQLQDPYYFTLQQDFFRFRLLFAFVHVIRKLGGQKRRTSKKVMTRRHWSRLARRDPFFLNRTHEGSFLPTPKIKCMPNPRFRNVKNWVSFRNISFFFQK